MFRGLGRGARRYGPWLLISAVLLAALAARIGLPLRVEMDISAMSPRDDPSLRNFRYFQENFGVTETLVLVGRGRTQHTEERMNALVQWLRGTTYFTSVERMPLPQSVDGVAIIAFPRRPSTDHAFGKAMLNAVRARLVQEPIEVEITGGAAVATESIENINRDVARTAMISLVLIVALLLLFIADPLFPLFAVVPLGISILVTLALARLLYGEMNLLTASLPTTLIGMGIDYAVYIRNSERECGSASADTWARVFESVGPPMAISVLTTSAAIFALCLAQLPGLRQMGLVCGLGLLTIFVTTLLLTPTLLDWRDRLGVRWRSPSDAWLAWLAERIVRHRLVTLALFGIVTIPLLLSALGLRFDLNPNSYRDPDLPSLRAFRRFEEQAGLTLEMILLAAPDLKSERAAAQKIRRHVGEGRTFALMDSLGEQFDRLGSTAPVRRYIGRDKHLCTMLFPREDPYEGQNLERLKAETASLVEECKPYVVRYSGMPLVWQQLMEVTRRDLLRTTGAAAAIVVLVLALLIRRPRSVIAALVPLAGSMIWMLGTMRLAGVRFSLISAVSMPLVLGLGVGYGVYIVHRLRQDSVERSVVVVGRAIIVSATTTAGAFFALCAAGNPALAGMGLGAGVGITACLLWSLVFLPAFAAEIQARRTARKITS